jgi:hypothetical protein
MYDHLHLHQSQQHIHIGPLNVALRASSFVRRDLAKDWYDARTKETKKERISSETLRTVSLKTTTP